MEYLERLRLQNLLVPGINQLEGVIAHNEGGGIAIVTTHQEVAMIGANTRTIELGRRDA